MDTFALWVHFTVKNCQLRAITWTDLEERHVDEWNEPDTKGHTSNVCTPMNG